MTLPSFLSGLVLVALAGHSGAAAPTDAAFADMIDECKVNYSPVDIAGLIATGESENVDIALRRKLDVPAQAHCCPEQIY